MVVVPEWDHELVFALVLIDANVVDCVVHGNDDVFSVGQERLFPQRGQKRQQSQILPNEHVDWKERKKEKNVVRGILYLFIYLFITSRLLFCLFHDVSEYFIHSEKIGWDKQSCVD